MLGLVEVQACRIPMAHSICSVVKAPVGWLVLLDGVRLGGVYVSRIEALNAAATAAAFVLKDGDGVQISVPASPERDGPTGLFGLQSSPADTVRSVSSSALSAADPHLRPVGGLAGAAPGPKSAPEQDATRKPRSRLGFYHDWQP
jgi:hypothetical protein